MPPTNNSYGRNWGGQNISCRLLIESYWCRVYDHEYPCWYNWWWNSQIHEWGPKESKRVLNQKEDRSCYIAGDHQISDSLLWRDQYKPEYIRFVEGSFHRSLRLGWASHEEHRLSVCVQPLQAAWQGAESADIRAAVQGKGRDDIEAGVPSQSPAREHDLVHMGLQVTQLERGEEVHWEDDTA